MPPNNYDFYKSVKDDMVDYTDKDPIIFSPGFGAQGHDTNMYTDVHIDTYIDTLGKMETYLGINGWF